MASPFTAKRVQVPGLLSDEGLAVKLKDLQGASKTAQRTAPPPNSAVDMADNILALPNAMPTMRVPGEGQQNPFPGLKLPTQSAPQPQTGFGMLNPQQQQEERTARLGLVTETEQLDRESMELVERLEAFGQDAYDRATREERISAGLPASLGTSIEKMREITSASLARSTKDVATKKKEPLPTQTWWMNMMQVGARTAAQTGTSALKYPFVVYEAAFEGYTGLNPGKAPPREWLDNVDKEITKLLPGDPARAKDFLTELAAGGGSMSAFLLTGYIGRVLGLPAGLTSGSLGAAVGGTQQYEEAESFGASSLQKFWAMVLGSGLGATEALPIENAFFRADVATGGLVRRMLSNTAATSLEEFAQEVGQAVGEDVIAKYIAQYDPKRQIDPGSWMRQGLVGAITGGAVGGLTTFVPGAEAPVELSQVDEAQLTTAVEEALDASQKQFDDILGPEADDLGDGAQEGAAPEAAAPVSTDAAQPASPRPVGDAVQQIIESAKPVQQTAVPGAADETNLAPDFLEAFKDTKIVDDAGQPLLVYRGTNVGQEHVWGRHPGGVFFTPDRGYAEGYSRVGGARRMFSREYHARQREQLKSGRTVDIEGMKLRVNQRGSEWYVERNGREAGGPYPTYDKAAQIAAAFAPQPAINGVVHAYINAKNPFVIDWGGGNWNAGSLVDERAKGLSTDDFVAQNKDRLQAEGYDAIILQNVEGAGAFDKRVKAADEYVVFDASQIIRAEDVARVYDPNIDSQIARPVIDRQTIEATPLSPAETTPLPNHEAKDRGPIPIVVKAAKAYAAAVGIPHRRQREYVKVDVARAARIAQAYADMKHEPQDPAVLAAYQAMAEETLAQYQFVKAAGIVIEPIPSGSPDPYPSPKEVLADIARGHMWYYRTEDGFGPDQTVDVSDNPLLEATGERDAAGNVMLVNDVFRVVHDFFGHGLEGSGFRARGEENAWQAHMRLYSASALPAVTSETRGQNSWVNYGPYGEQNRKATAADTVYADQKTGIMPSWTWEEGVVDSATSDALVEGVDPVAFVDALQAAKDSSPYGAVVNVYKPSKYARMRLFLTEDGLSGFALDGVDIVSVFSHNNAPRGRLRTLIDTAVANGGRTLDAFDTGLPAMYAALGFVEVRREPWNEKYKPKGWPESLGKPDVVYMEFGQDIERMEAWEDRRAKWHEGSHEYFKNADGTPKVFYHGTEKGGFREFDTRPSSSKTEGTGAWFTPDRYQAASYGRNVDVEIKDYDALADRILNGEAVEISGYTYTLERTDEGDYIHQEGHGLKFADGPFEAATEVREFLEDQFQDDSRQSGVYSVYLRAKNPAIIDWGGANWAGGPMEEGWAILDPGDLSMFAEPYAIEYDEDSARETAQQLLDEREGDDDYEGVTVDDIIERRQLPGAQSTDAFVREIFEMDDSIDAVVLQNVEGSGPNGYGSGTADEIVIRDPTSIKSTANIGTYSETDPDILRMTGTATARNPYRGEPTRPTQGIAAQPDAEPNDVKLTKISENFRKLLGLTVRQGRLTAKGAGAANVMGEYNRRSATIRMRIWSDLSTLVHEGGHALNDMMAQPLNDFVQRNNRQILKIGTTYYAGDLSQAPAMTVAREGFAEFFRLYALTPAYARKKFGALVDDFERVLDAEDPKLKSGLEQIAEQYKAWLQLPSSQLIRNQVIDGRREKGIGLAVKELKDLGFKSWMQEHARRAVEYSINRYAPLAQLTTDILKLGQENLGQALDLKRADNPENLARLARNSGSRAMVEITDGVIGYRSTQSISRGLRDGIMTALGVDPDTTPGSLDEERLKDFDTYLVARRAFDEYRRFDEGTIDRPPINASKGDVVKTIKEYESQYGDAFVNAAEIVHEYGMALWQKQYDAGLIAKETYEEGLERQFYVPLQRDMSDKKGDFGPSALTSKGQGLQSLVRRFRGSDRDIVSPTTILMHKTFALEALIAENDVKKALAILADRAGAAGALVERIPASQAIGMTMTVEDAARQLTKDDTLSATDAADLMTILGASIKEGNSITLFRREQVSTKGENILFFWENGKPAAIQLKDGDLGADVINTMNGIGRENMDWWLEAIAATSMVFRTAITSWPDFLIVNYIRDQVSAWVLNDTGFIPFVSGMGGIVDEVRQKQWAKSYNAAGGIMGGMNVAALHEARVDRDITALRSKGYLPQVFSDKTPILGALRGFGRLTAVSETGTRLGIYKGAFNRGKRDGLSDYEASVEAAYIATDYIDFGLNGSKMLMARRTIPFLNAQLQGFYKMIRTLGASEVAQRKGLKFVLGAYFKSTKNMDLSRTEKQALNTGRKAWVKMMSLGVLSAILHFLFEDDEDYQEAGEYLRVTHWVIPTGNGNLLTIPKPFELAMIANAVERGIEFASGDTTAKDRFLRGVAFSLTPPTAPPGIASVVELAANYDFFTGREIVPGHMQALQPMLQYDRYTSSLARWMGQTFNWSPLQIDHVLSGMGASAYRDLNWAINQADPNRPSPDETDAPILRRFIRDTRRGSVSAQDFWAQASQTTGKLERAAATYKQFIENGNNPAAERFLQTLPADEQAYARLMTREVEEKRLNPFYRARQVTTIISGMRREVASDLSLSDTTIKDSGATIPMTAQKKGDVDEILSELARREVRNTLIATQQPGWLNKEVLPVQPTLDLLAATAPDVYDEYLRRVAKRKVYGAELVFENWPEVRDRLNGDGEFAVLADLTAVAEATAGMVF